jgi:hypothetical protein
MHCKHVFQFQENQLQLCWFDGVLKEVELTGSAELVTADLGCFNLGVGYHNITLESVSGVVNLDIALLVDFAESFYGYSNLVDSNFTMVSGSEYYVTGETNNVVFLEGGYGYWNVCGSFYNDIILLPVFNYGSLFIDIGSENGCILKYAGYSYVEQSVFVAFFAMILLLVGLNFLNNKWFIVYNF